MRNLLNFLLRYSSWFVFMIYVLVSCYLLFKSDPYHRSVYMSSANAVSSKVYGLTSNVTEYFALKSQNESLRKATKQLRLEVLNLKEQVAALKSKEIESDTLSFPRRYDFVSAPVINNSTRRPNNFITIRSGSEEGLRPGMGVIGNEGIVGIVDIVGTHASRVISLLSEDAQYSVKIKNRGHVGSLVWRGHDPKIGYVIEIPRHAQFAIGDTIITSGYSTTFPEGLMVGTVMSRVREADDNFFTLKIKLATDFAKLTHVEVIKDSMKAELDSLSKSGGITELQQ